MNALASRPAARSWSVGLALMLAFMAPVQPVNAQAIPSNTLDPQEIAATLQLVADWQLGHPSDHDPRHWSMAALYNGLISASLATGNPRYLAAVLRAGLRIHFILGSRRYHADGHAPGHAWLRIYMMDPDRDPDFLEPFIEKFNEIVDHPIDEVLRFSEEPPEGLFRTDRWSWADALYMAPPTIALLAKATGDKRYYRFIDSEIRLTYDMLYDREEHLFYRDDTYIDDRTPSGEKVFWSRGNAWVYAGLSRLLEYLPQDYPLRCFYMQLFLEMTEAIVAAQQPDGHWYTSLLDPQHVPVGETSGSALFVSGLARGVQLGILDAETYWPTIAAGWNAILTRIAPDGGVNFVQPFGEAPEVFPPEVRQTYGSGSVLLAGSEIILALEAQPELDQAAFLQEASELVDEAPDLSSVCHDPCFDPEEDEPAED